MFMKAKQSINSYYIIILIIY